MWNVNLFICLYLFVTTKVLTVLAEVMITLIIHHFQRKINKDEKKWAILYISDNG